MSYSDIRLGGSASPGLLYGRISDSLKQVQSDCAMMAHLYAAEEGQHSKDMAKGWLLMSEWFKFIQQRIISMEVGRAQ